MRVTIVRPNSPEVIRSLLKKSQARFSTGRTATYTPKHSFQNSSGTPNRLLPCSEKRRGIFAKTREISRKVAKAINTSTLRQLRVSSCFQCITKLRMFYLEGRCSIHLSYGRTLATCSIADLGISCNSLLYFAAINHPGWFRRGARSRSRGDRVGRF